MKGVSQYHFTPTPSGGGKSRAHQGAGLMATERGYGGGGGEAECRTELQEWGAEPPFCSRCTAGDVKGEASG